MFSKYRVFFGFVAGACFALMSHVGSWPRALLGLTLALVGLALRGWAAGYLEKGKRLAQDGPYAWFRHPLYAGSFLMALGFLFAGTSGRWPIHNYLLWGVFILLFIVVYPTRIKEEESSLEKYFGDAWRQFVARNHRFLPRLTPTRRANPDTFSWARYRKNTEYNAAIGWAVGTLLLVIKGILHL